MTGDTSTPYTPTLDEARNAWTGLKVCVVPMGDDVAQAAEEARAGFDRMIAGLNSLAEARIAQTIAYVRASWLGEGEPVRNTPAGEKRPYQSDGGTR